MLIAIKDIPWLLNGAKALETFFSSWRSFSPGNIEFLHGDHIPFVVLAISMLIVFIIVPTLILICYPFRCFQKCLSYYQIRLHCLRTFVDSFQGCYKDGTEPGTYDLRWLSSYGLVFVCPYTIIYVFYLHCYTIDKEIANSAKMT